MNAYAEPVVSLDLDLVVAPDQRASVERVLAAAFEVARFPHPLDCLRRVRTCASSSRPKGCPMGSWRDCCDPTGQITVTAMPHPHVMASVFRRQRL